MLLLSWLDDWGAGAIEFFIMIGIHICSMVYNLVNFLFDIFVTIVSAQIFNTSDYAQIANSIYLVIGVVALFIIAYGLLRAIIDPDGAAKSNFSAKKIIPNVLISIALIAFVPTIFSTGYKVQKAVISTNLIPNVVLGMNMNGNDKAGSCTAENPDACSTSKDYIYYSGRKMANAVFISFFVPTQDDAYGNIDSYYESITTERCFLFFCKKTDFSFKDAINDVNGEQAGFGIYSEFAGSMHGSTQEDNKLEYNFLLQLICGCVLVYVLVNFCIDMAVRCVKLGYLQIIAPIPILTLMLPGQKKVFDNWLKNSIQTFLDVFIRIAIIFFGIVLINKLDVLGNDFWANSLANPRHPMWAKAFIIIGILIFMKQAPKFLADIFGISSGSFKLGIKDKLGEMALVGDKAKELVSNVEGVGKSVKGGVTGALGAGWTSRRNGMGWKTGMKYGFAKGWNSGKGNPNQFSAMRQDFYKGAMDGSGKAAFFGPGRAYFDKTSAQWTKDAKNAYKKNNFARVLEYQNRDDFKNLYENTYTVKREEISNKITEVKDKKTAVSNEYSEMVNRIQSRIDEYKKHYADADGNISNTKARDAIVDLENQKANIEFQQKNDSRLLSLDDQLGELNKKLKTYDDEHEYVIKGKYEKDGKLVDRSYDTELDFFKKHGGFSDIMDDVDAIYKKGEDSLKLPAHPDYKDVDDTHRKYLAEAEVSRFVSSIEGQKAVKVREMADKEIFNGGGSSADKKSDKK